MNHEQACLFPSGNQHNHSGANALCLSALMADTKVQKRLVNWLASQGQWAKETDSHPSCLTPRSKLLVNVLYFLGQETSSLSILPHLPAPHPSPARIIFLSSRFSQHTGFLLWSLPVLMFYYCRLCKACICPIKLGPGGQICFLFLGVSHNTLCRVVPSILWLSRAVSFQIWATSGHLSLSMWMWKSM